MGATPEDFALDMHESSRFPHARRFVPPTTAQHGYMSLPEEKPYEAASMISSKPDAADYDYYHKPNAA